MQKLRTEIRELRTGIGPPAVFPKKMCEEGEHLALVRRGHSSYDGRCEIRVRCRDVVRHPVSVGKHTVHIDDGHVKRREFKHGSVSRAKRRIVRTRCRQEGCTTAEGSRRIPHHFAFQVRCTSVTYDRKCVETRHLKRCGEGRSAFRANSLRNVMKEIDGLTNG